MSARNRLQHAPVVPAPEGFGLRFMRLLADRKRRRQSRQAWLVFSLSLLGSLGTMSLLAYFQASRLAEGLANLVKGLIELSNQVSVLGDLVVRFLGLLPGPAGGIFGLSLLVATAGGMIALFAGLGMLWSAAVYRFAYPSRTLGGRS
jgi:hypothetical protein